VDRLDVRADIYSLGAILEFLVASRESAQALGTASVAGAAFTAPSKGGEPAPNAVGAIARKAMDQEPDRRYASVSDLVQDVGRYLDGWPVSAYPENIFQRAARWTTRYRVAIGLVLAYLVVRALLLVWLKR
jgi:serine/threonine-protein kinase